MPPIRQVEIFLGQSLLHSAEEGQHNFLNLVSNVLSEGGMQPVYRHIDDAYDCNTRHSLIHMKAPVSESGLVFRRTYHYPFWQIERTEKRGDWDVAHAAFDPASIDGAQANKFARFWRNRLFPETTQSDGDHIYVPLQGKLMQRRSFQSASPIEMLESVLAASSDPVVAALHPKETYEPAEIDALEKLAAKYANLEVVTGEMLRYLPNCKLVVTQNSSVAFNGYFFRKPTILFADIDFHHIAVTLKRQPFAQAMDQALANTPDYEKYLWWFWQDQSINAGRSEAQDKIHARLTRFGWPLAGRSE